MLYLHPLNATQCQQFFYYTRIPKNIPCSQRVPSAPLPACLLHTRDVSSKRVDPELVLLLVSAFFSVVSSATYAAHPEVAKDTSALASHYTSVLDLREPRVAVHLRELELGLGAHTLWERRVSYYVSERLSRGQSVSCGRCAEARPRRHTVQARWPRRPSVSCGRECCGSWQSRRCRASSRGTGT